MHFCFLFLIMEVNFICAFGRNRPDMSGPERNVSVISIVIFIINVLSSRAESNRHHQFRKLKFYPLNYERD